MRLNYKLLNSFCYKLNSAAGSNAITSSVKAESYLSLTILNPQQKERYSENPLVFRRDNSKNYPILAQLVSVF